MSKSAWLCLLIAPALVAQTLTPQDSHTTASLRGVSAVNAQVCWASGTKGTFLRTIDGGQHWTVGTVPGAEALDFRDVEAIDASTAYLLSIGPGANSRVYKTLDAGLTWRQQFTNPDEKGFFDGFAFWDATHGILFGDPVDGRFVIAITEDGETWRKLNPQMPVALEKEGAFAASGTSIVVAGKHDVWFATGGASSARVFHSTDRGKTWTVAQTPVRHGDQLSGIFGLLFWDTKHGLAIGGNDKLVDDPTSTLALTQDGGRTWTSPTQFPSGFRSAAARSGKWLVTVGRAGMDISGNLGKTWRSLLRSGYHAVSFARHNDVGWAVGAEGHLTKMTFP